MLYVFPALCHSSPVTDVPSARHIRTHWVLVTVLPLESLQVSSLWRPDCVLLLFELVVPRQRLSAIWHPRCRCNGTGGENKHTNHNKRQRFLHNNFPFSCVGFGDCKWTRIALYWHCPCRTFIAYAMVAVGHCFTRTFFASSRSQNKAMPNGIPPFFYSLSLY